MERQADDSFDPASRGGGFWRIGAGYAVAVCIVLAAGLMLLWAVVRAREAARQSACQGHLNQLQMALANYHEAYGCFPPAYVRGPDGKPWHSWRVLILPFFEYGEVYEAYDFNEPWDGPNNRRLAQRIYNEMFHCPSGPLADDAPLTEYVAIVGPGTAFPGSGCVSRDDMADGPENTILLAEIAGSTVHWMEPRDLHVEEMSFAVNDRAQPSISSPHMRGPAVVFADRISAWALDESLRPETVRALTTIAGGEPVTKRQLANPADEHPRTLVEQGLRGRR